MQLRMPLTTSFEKDAYAYGERASGETHGVVLTKPHVVDLILDLARYTADRPLASLHLLEPSCGTGAFLVPAVTRLLAASRREGVAPKDLLSCISAYDIDEEHVAATRDVLLQLLRQHDVPARQAKTLVETWVRQGDFLLSEVEAADVVVGNPPYIRIEQLSEALLREYRRRFKSLYDRADLYVAFMEKSLDLLTSKGLLSFICADRWVLNRYGAPLRQKISEGFRIQTYIDLHQASPFESEVIAYPSIFAIGRGKSKNVMVARMKDATPEECGALADVLLAPEKAHSHSLVSIYEKWFQGDEPWVLSPPGHLETLRALEARFASIEADGSTKVRIGVATGNDRVFIVPADADVEKDRLVPLVMRADIEQGHIKDTGHYVINTFDANGKVVDLQKYPRLRAYFARHEEALRKRHVAQKKETGWFRTIDRVYPELVKKPKLLLPDIAGSNEVVYDEGRFHPHHNLYFVTSEKWDMEVFGGLLSSKVALFFIWSYAVKMRGGYLRFQAQYLRRIRLPDPDTISARDKAALKKAFQERRFADLDKLAIKVYGLKALPEFEFVDTRS